MKFTDGSLSCYTSPNGVIITNPTSNCQLACYSGFVDYVDIFTRFDYDDERDVDYCSDTIMDTYDEEYSEHLKFFKKVYDKSVKALLLFDVRVDEMKIDEFIRKFFKGHILVDSEYESTNFSTMNIFVVNLRNKILENNKTKK